MKKKFSELAHKSSFKSPFGVIFCFSQNLNFNCNYFWDIYFMVIHFSKVWIYFTFIERDVSKMKHLAKRRGGVLALLGFKNLTYMNLWWHGTSKREKLSRKAVMVLILPAGQLFFFWNRSITAAFRGFQKYNLSWPKNIKHWLTSIYISTQHIYFHTLLHSIVMNGKYLQKILLWISCHSD